MSDARNASPDDALAALRGASAWILTDGKAGDEAPCLAVAEALGLAAEAKRVRPRRLFAWLAPHGPVDPRDRAGRTGSLLAPPFPDLAIASGRRAVPYLRALKRAAGARTFTVFLKDPRVGVGAADLIWVFGHDRLRGPNVLATPTPPHRVSAARLAAARNAPDPRLSWLGSPRVAVLVGGDSRHGRVREPETARFLAGLRAVAADGGSLMVTASRRTPPALASALRALVGEIGGFFHAPGEPGDNPYLAMLALAEAVVVTADSANMVCEAVATGAPVHLATLAEPYVRHRTLFSALADEGAVKPFVGRVEAFRYKPLDATPRIAREIARAVMQHRSAAGSTREDARGGSSPRV